MKIKRITVIGISVSLAMILSYLESMIPSFVPVPGIKIGLSNLIIVILLYSGGTVDAFLTDIIRIILSSVLFGSPLSFLFSISGGLLSFFVMWLLKKTGILSVLSISAAGGVCHNTGQLVMAIIILKSPALYYYLPPLLMGGLLTGLFNGIVSAELVRYLNKIK
jgi:heptaprenyl diphosphate synthase